MHFIFVMNGSTGKINDFIRFSLLVVVLRFSNNQYEHDMVMSACRY